MKNKLRNAAIAALMLTNVCFAGTRDLREDSPATIIVGPFVNGTGAVTSPDVTTIDVVAYKNNGSTDNSIVPTASLGSNDMSATDDGYYSLELTSGNTDTAGYYRLTFQVDGSLIFHEDFNILPTNVYDSRYSTDKLDVNVEEWNATSVPSEHAPGYPIVTVKDGIGTGEIDSNSGKLSLTQAEHEAIASRSCIAAGTVASGSGTLWDVNVSADWTNFGVYTDLAGCIIVFQDTDDLGGVIMRIITAQEEGSLTLNSSISSGIVNAGDKFRVYPSSPQIMAILEDTGTSGVQLPNGEIAAATFGAGAIDAAAIAADAIGSSEIANGAIDADVIASNAINAAKVAADVASEIRNELDANSTKLNSIFNLLDGAPTFAEAMDDHHYTSGRADKLDNLDDLDMPVSEVRANTPSLLVTTEIDDSSVATTQTSFALAAGPSNDDALNGALVVVTDDSNPLSIKKAVGLVKEYDQATKTVTLFGDPGGFEFGDGNKVDVIASGAHLPLW